MDRPLVIFARRVLVGSACAFAVGCGQSADRAVQLAEQRTTHEARPYTPLEARIQTSQQLTPPRELRIDTEALPIEIYQDAPSVDTSQNQTVAHGGRIEQQGPALTTPPTGGGSTDSPYFESRWSAPGADAASGEPIAPRLLQEHVTTPQTESTAGLAGTSLPWGNETVRTPEMQAVEERANTHIQRGMELGGRGATYSARAEFIQALQIIAAALDVHRQTRAHSEALAAGLRALEEAEDFIVEGSELEAALDLRLIIDSHRTPVLQAADKHDLNAVMAIQTYYTYAQEQLSVAAAQQPAGSAALYALGRLQLLANGKSEPDWASTAPKAVVFYQSALAANPKNALAANEVGVLLARFGRYHDAKNVLLHGAMGSPQPASWHNLAVIHRKLGEVELAQRAEQEAKLATQVREQTTTGPHKIELVPPEEFARGARPSGELRSSTATNDKPEATATSDKKTAFEWLPWSKSSR